MDKILGPIVGHVSPTTARLWALCRPAGQAVTVRIQSGMGALPDVPAVEVARGIHVCDVTGLTPGTRYSFQLVDAQGTAIALGAGRFRTLETSFDSFAFALASCHKHDFPQCDERWRRLVERLDTDLLRMLVLCGDQIYADSLWGVSYSGDAHRLQAFENRYLESWYRSAIQSAMSIGPTYMIWDDHDIRDDWGSLATDTVPPSSDMFRAALETYQRYQNAHNPPGYGGKVHYGVQLGPLSFYFLDLRGARKAGATWPVMGDGQWADFEAWLGTQQCEVLFVVASVPFAHIGGAGLVYAKQMGLELGFDTLDHWNHPNNRHELKRMLDRLFAWQNVPGSNRQVVVVSGDVHVATVGTIFHPEPLTRNRIYQLTSSAIANQVDGGWRDLVPQVYRSLVTGKIDLGSGYYSLNDVCSTRPNFGEVGVHRGAGGRWQLTFDLEQADPAEPRKRALDVGL
jgi:hypothetical protein